MSDLTLPAKSENNFGALRLLFAALVVLSHSFELIDGNRSREPLTSLFGTITSGQFAVGGFFLVSGYLITNSWETSKSNLDYMAKRALRIYPAFVVAFILTLFVAGPLGGGNLGELSGFTGFENAVRLALLKGPKLDSAFPGLVVPQLNSSMWTISYEFRCYVIAMLLGIAGATRRPARYVALTWVMLAALAALPNVSVPASKGINFLIGDMHDNLIFLSLFCCGGSFYLLRQSIGFPPALVLAAFAALCLCLQSHRFAQPGLALFGGYLLFWLALVVRPNKLTRWCNHTDISYGLYLYAWPVQNLIIWYYRSISPGQLFVLSLALAACAGAASWFVIERPALSLKRKLGGAFCLALWGRRIGIIPQATGHRPQATGHRPQASNGFLTKKKQETFDD